MLSAFPNLVHGFSTAEYGNMAFKFGSLHEAIANRDRFVRALGLELGQTVHIDGMLHGAEIALISGSQCGRGVSNDASRIRADALITSEVGVALWLGVGDCIPMLFYDPEERFIALAHLGWKGTDLELAFKTAQKMVAMGSNPADIRVSMGPSIKKESYVNPALGQRDNPKWRPYLEDTGFADLYEVDITGYNQTQLQDAGIPASNIEISPVDTATSDKFFSHYRSVRENLPDRRFAALICMSSS